MSRNASVIRGALSVGAIVVAFSGQPGIALAGDNPFAVATGGNRYQLADAAGPAGQGSRCGAGSESGQKGCKMMLRMDTDGNGQISREEFMKGHEAMFDEIDSNGDGQIDAGEREARMEMKRQMKGKCGQ